MIAFISLLFCASCDKNPPIITGSSAFLTFPYTHTHTHTTKQDCMQTNCCSRIISGKHQLAMLVVMIMLLLLCRVWKRERNDKFYTLSSVPMGVSIFMCLYIVEQSARREDFPHTRVSHGKLICFSCISHTIFPVCVYWKHYVAFVVVVCRGWGVNELKIQNQDYVVITYHVLLIYDGALGKYLQCNHQKMRKCWLALISWIVLFLQTNKNVHMQLWYKVNAQHLILFILITHHSILSQKK